MTPAALIVNPGGRPVAVQAYGDVPPLADSVRLAAVPTVLLLPPGLATVTTAVPLPADLNAATPFGVPSPVGPSHPARATQSGTPQVPFEPVVTSLRLLE
jgi:hypothetical protein